MIWESDELGCTGASGSQLQVTLVLFYFYYNGKSLLKSYFFMYFVLPMPYQKQFGLWSLEDGALGKEERANHFCTVASSFTSL